MNKVNNKKSVFNGFTNLYELSKTLRFELKPVENTQKMLDEADVFGKDKIIQEKYQQTKPFIDRLHREFVDEALSQSPLSDLKNYFKIFEIWRENKKDKEIIKKLKNEAEGLRKEIVGFFNTTAKHWAGEKYKNLGLKNKDIGILFEKGVFDLLKEKYGKEDNAFLKDEYSNFLKNEKGEKLSIFDEWKGFVGYFTKFQETRKNFYKDEGKAGQIATRIIDQNLKRFCDNLKDFKKIKNKIDFSEIEKNFGKTANDVFSFDFYNQCLLQEGIDSYNEFIGGKTLKNGEKLKGINELINKYRQDKKGEKPSFLKLLHKQILSEKEKFIIGIENDDKLIEALKSFYKTAEEKTKILRTLFSDFVEHNENYDLSKTYISKEALNTIAYKWTGDTKKFEECIFEVINQKEIREWYDSFRKDKKDPKVDKDENGYKFPNFIILQHLKDGLEKNKEERLWKEKYYKNEDNKKDKGFLTGKENAWDQFLQIFNFELNSLFKKEIEHFIDKNKNFNKKLEQFQNTEKVLESNEKEGKIKTEIGYSIFRKHFENIINKKEFKNDENSKIAIKNFADSVLWIYQMAKYFAIEKKRNWNDDYELSEFYTNSDRGYLLFHKNAYEEIIKTYNDLRNYLTKKPYSEEKRKLNFENPTLANGFDKNKESDNSAVILLKDGKYYLGLMKKGNNKIFDDRNNAEFVKNIENGVYKKIVYKLFSDPKKDFPHVCFSKKGLDFFKPSEVIVKIYENKEFKKGNNFSVVKMQKLIGFYIDCLSKYDGWRCYDFTSVKKPESYTENIDEFYRDVSQNGYKISFKDISRSYIDEKNKNGELYLFKIYNQDFAEGKTGKKNLHTLYFENVFSPENIAKNFPIKLNGQAELFFRPKKEEAGLGYKKWDKKEKKWVKVKNRENGSVIDRKRYSEDKIFFHCPITLNRGKGSLYGFNNYINDFLSENDINIIGVDRGEKHLAYYSVIDPKGKILDSGSFNEINKVNYAEKLEERAGDREQARQDWQRIEGIKDLKRGYISQVVRKLADLAIEHNAIIVLEDLNMRFKQIRGGIEKSIYQQLEKALIDKLSFLVEKGEKDPNQAGHLLKAYQLAAPFTSFKEMGKQTGIIFYTQASYTSKTCPQCGFRKNNNKFYFENNIGKAENVLKKLKTFEYNDKNQCFNLSYSLSEFMSNEDAERNKNKKRSNVLYSNINKKDLFSINTKGAIRYRWHDKNTERGKIILDGESVYEEGQSEEVKNTKRGIVKKYDITKCLFSLFEGAKLDYKQNLLDKLLSEKFDSNFYKNLFNYLNLLFEIRNSISGTEIDYISCPKCGFCSDDESAIVKNGDENGAYNIARKGIMVLEKIKQYKKENGILDKMNWGDLFIDIDEWDKFVQK